MSVRVFIFLLAIALAAGASGGEAALVEHTFLVSQIMMRHLCNDTLVTVVNGQLPGPVIEVTEGDSLVIHVINKSPLGVTIHWHGVKQHLNCWADGPAMITQCPIQPNNNFTYRFNVIGQEGTLWWHAHAGSLRATIHGALIIRPRSSPSSYPFPRPDKEIPLVIGEWWDVDLVQMERNLANSNYKDMSRATTLNGNLGDLNKCYGVIEENYYLNVEHGKTYLLRIVNAALHSEFYFKVAGHNFTVVAADANYVKPYTTDIIAIAPGETVDALVVANAPPGKYYMTALTIQSPEPMPQLPVDITRGIVYYSNSSNGSEEDTLVISPEMPHYNDASKSFYFHGNLTTLPHPLLHPVPVSVDERLLITVDTGYLCKEGGSVCTHNVARMNNISFQLPTATSLLEAQYYHNMTIMNNVREFPSTPPRNIVYNNGTTMKATSLRRIPYNTTLEIVFQGPPTVLSFANPMHIHGHDFFILAQGLGIYDADRDVQTYNLVDPPVKNTAPVPTFGWVAIRFVARNPGVWYLHCVETHALVGMSMAFVVENGPTLDTTLPPPQADYSICNDTSSKVVYE